MAHSASGRFSSEYHTASSEGFDPQHEALNSTVAFNEETQGSADMSIEVGRGVGRTAREDVLSEDGSSLSAATNNTKCLERHL